LPESGGFPKLTVLFMNPITKVVGALRDAANHPVNRHRKFKAVIEYGFLQVATRLVPGEICVEFPNRTRLLVSPHMKGAAHYITPRLCEFDDMSFVMHYLRPGDLFADVGANVGAFTILAAGVAGANVLAFEAAPDTYEMLARNVRLNNFGDRVNAIHAAAGRTEGTAQFTAGLGTENHVLSGANANGTVTVRMTTLDKELAGIVPEVLKVDVEGFETEVFAGATRTLRNSRLKAIIVERDNLGARYGFDEEPLHREIRECGFTGCHYEPFKRQLFEVDETARNIIYVRDKAAANERLKAAKPFTLGEFSC
jgi:FkbM family methyltransferase